MEIYSIISELRLSLSFRLSQKVILEVGDKVRISGGPYYLAKSGNRIGMGEKGIGTFLSAQADGHAIYVKFGGAMGSIRFVYIGPEHISESTGTVMRPHKITKLRK